MRGILIQIVVFFAIFQILTFIKESNMLSTDTSMRKYDFTLTSTMGDTVSLTPNKKKTIVYFFAPWCTVCHASIENLQNIYQKNQEIEVIAVGLDFVEREEIEAFVSNHQLTFPVVYGNSEVKKAFQITAYPSYYVLDEQNTIIAKSMGYSTELGLYLRSL